MLWKSILLLLWLLLLMHELGLWLFDIVGIAFVGASEVDRDKVDMACLAWVGTT